MKFNACWTSPVYPVLKDQSNWNMCKNKFYKKDSPLTVQFLDCNNERFPKEIMFMNNQFLSFMRTEFMRG